MDREIKFRGKSSLCDTWLYGLLVRVGCMYYIAEENDFDTDGHHIKQVQDMPLDVERDTIGQFTGLYDRNQKPIYEGDIVQWWECVADYTFITQKSEVFYSENSASFEPLNEFNYCDFEVIGNIYDNKELLGE